MLCLFAALVGIVTTCGLLTICSHATLPLHETKDTPITTSTRASHIPHEAACFLTIN